MIPNESNNDLDNIFRLEVEALQALSASQPGVFVECSEIKNIVQLLDHSSAHSLIDENGDKNEVHFIALQYFKKKTLREFLLEKGSLSSSLSKSYFKQLMNALEQVHGKGYAHRDIKLENLMLSEEYDLKLIDFGAVTKSQSSTTI